MEFSSNLVTQLNAGTILPEGIIILTLIAVLVWDLIAGRNSARALAYVAIAGLLASVIALCLGWSAANPLGFFESL